MNRWRLHIAILCMCFTGHAFSQNSEVNGRITDAESGEALAYVNIHFQHTQVGTTTDESGWFELKADVKADTLVISYIGYETRKIYLPRGRSENLRIKLQPKGYQLDEVVILPGENPAHVLLRKVWEHKDKNAPKNLDYYSYDVYNKLEFDLNNLTQDFDESRLLKPFAFLEEYVDTADLNGKSYLPFFLSETMSTIYYSGKKDEEIEKITANKISGITNESLKQFTGDMYQDVNIYDNVVEIFEKGFVSPIGRMGKMYYKYYLTDSAFIDNNWCYKLQFTPRRKHELTFEGEVWIHDTTYAVKAFDVNITETANINFIDEIRSSQAFTRVDDSTWMLSYDKLIVDFNLLKRSEGFYGRKTSYYRNHRINEAVDKRIFSQSHPSNLIYAADTVRDDLYWEERRPVALQKREQDIYFLVDTVQEVPAFKTWEDIVTTLATGYYKLGPIEIGPYYTFYSGNPEEGTRFKFGMRTSNDFSERLMLEAFAAYGLTDKELKYGGGARYMFSTLPRRSAGLYYTRDYYEMLGKVNALQTDNILSTLLRRDDELRLSMKQQWQAFYEYEWEEGISNTLSLYHQRIFPPKSANYFVKNENPQLRDLVYRHENSLYTSEIRLNMRIAKGEKFLRGKFERISLGTNKPVFNIDMAYAPERFLGNKYSYFNLNFSMKDKIRMYPLGELRYTLQTGKIWGAAPYPFLHVPQGNQSYAFYDYAFNLMSYYEFVSDQYVSLMAEQHFHGFFLNHIPLMRKLKWREHIGFRTIYGSRNSCNSDLMIYPEFVHSFNNQSGDKMPYMEVNAGISNIFKVLRLDAVWRLSHTYYDNVPKFGVMAKLEVNF